MGMVRLPLVGKASAGDGEHNVDADDAWAMLPEVFGGPDHLAFVIEGDSMMPALEPGDIAVFKESHQPRSKVAFLVKDRDGYRVKQIRWNRTDGEWVLRSLNPKYADERIEGGQLLGFLIGLYRQRGTRYKMDLDLSGLPVEGED
jgi:phage repressor protein C with HTH and peptisase S24 domain